MADQAKETPKAAQTKASEKSDTIRVKAKDGTQMYDPVSRTLFTDDAKGVEVAATNNFVVVNLERGKLKKVG